MKSLVDHLSQYAAYHRDPRNIASHFIGIPLIVVAVAVLLSRPEWAVGGLWLSPAVLLALFSAWFYLRLELALGALMTVLMGLSVWAGHVLAAQSTLVWLSSGIGMFVLGWVIQFVGHYYEGRKPAFVDDVSGLIVGPLFVVAELAFLLGLRHDLKQQIEARSGPHGETTGGRFGQARRRGVAGDDDRRHCLAQVTPGATDGLQAVHAAEAEVAEDQIDSGAALAQGVVVTLAGLVHRGARVDAMPPQVEQVDQGFEHRRLIVDHQNTQAVYVDPLIGHGLAAYRCMTQRHADRKHRAMPLNGHQPNLVPQQARCMPHNG
ncbi:hypothetical protein BHE74_00001973 [Ensete ventricosum]|nr:hypothetical protein BHE74_00001973 [Ensete ventricosum]